MTDGPAHDPSPPDVDDPIARPLLPATGGAFAPPAAGPPGVAGAHASAPGSVAVPAPPGLIVPPAPVSHQSPPAPTAVMPSAPAVETPAAPAMPPASAPAMPPAAPSPVMQPTPVLTGPTPLPGGQSVAVVGQPVLVAPSPGVPPTELSAGAPGGPQGPGTGEPDPGASGPASPVKLRRTKPFHYLVLVLFIAGVPASIVDPRLGAAAGLTQFLTMLVWSYLAVRNVRRVKPATQHGRAPRPFAAVLWWFAPAFVCVAFLLGLAALNSSAEGTTFEGSENLDMVNIAIVCVFAVVALLAYAQPYACLARATRWVGGRGTKFLWWCWGPILAAPVGIVLFMVAGAMTRDAADDDPRVTVALGLVVLGGALPALVWLLQGHKAMTEIESAVTVSGSPSAGIEDFDPNDIADRIRKAAMYNAENGLGQPPG